MKFNDLPIFFQSDLPIYGKIIFDKKAKKVRCRTESPRGSHAGFTIEIMLRRGIDPQKAVNYLENLMIEGGVALLWAIYEQDKRAKGKKGEFPYSIDTLIRLHIPDEEVKPEKTLLLTKVGDGKTTQYTSKDIKIEGANGQYGIVEAQSRTGAHWDLFSWVLSDEAPQICASYVHNTCRGNVHTGKYCVTGETNENL